MTTQQQLDSFNKFVQLRVSQGEVDASLDDLFDRWRHENPSDELHEENVAAIAASIEDFLRGERGTLAKENCAKLRKEYGLPTP